MHTGENLIGIFLKVDMFHMNVQIFADNLYLYLKIAMSIQLVPLLVEVSIRRYNNNLNRYF